MTLGKKLNLLKNKSILIISPEPWNHDFVSKHHYSITLAGAGNRVYFLNPPSSSNKIYTSLIANIFIIDYVSNIRGLNRFPKVIAKRLMNLDISRIKKLIPEEIEIVWSFDPFRFQFLKLFCPAYSLYYAADLHPGIKEREAIIADQADIILSPSKSILDSVSASKPKYVIQHAVAQYFFKDLQAVTLPGKNKLKAVYVGNLKSKYLDNCLALDVITLNTNIDFVFIGDAEVMPSKIRSKDNVYCLGRRKNEELPDLLYSADILWLYYDTIRFAVAASNSHKIMEYLSSGKVVVSTRIAEYIDKNLLEMPETNQQLPVLMKYVANNIAVYNNTEQRSMRREYARKHTYEKQLEKIEEHLTMLKSSR